MEKLTALPLKIHMRAHLLLLRVLLVLSYTILQFRRICHFWRPAVVA